MSKGNRVWSVWFLPLLDLNHVGFGWVRLCAKKPNLYLNYSNGGKDWGPPHGRLSTKHFLCIFPWILWTTPWEVIVPILQIRQWRITKGKVFVHDQQLTLTPGRQTLPTWELSLGPPRNTHNAPAMVVVFPFCSQWEHGKWPAWGPTKGVSGRPGIWTHPHFPI